MQDFVCIGIKDDSPHSIMSSAMIAVLISKIMVADLSELNLFYCVETYK